MSISKASLLEEIREAVAKKKSETGERNAVVRTLAKHGAYSMPKIETGRFGKGATIRVYIWKTTWGSLVLSSGPSVEGEIQWVDKRSVSDAPDGYYHQLEKVTGASKITSAMKKIAKSQEVTGSTTVSKPKRKAAPKRKAVAKKKAAPSSIERAVLRHEDRVSRGEITEFIPGAEPTLAEDEEAEMVAAIGREQAGKNAEIAADNKAHSLVKMFKEVGNAGYLQDVMKMYHGNDEYESRAARSAINEFAQYAVPGVRIQEAHEIFAYAAGGGLSDDKIVAYYTENRADIDQAASWVAKIVDDRAASIQGVQDRADKRAVEPETMSDADELAQMMAMLKPLIEAAR